jgi:hypothetical protein
MAKFAPSSIEGLIVDCPSLRSSSLYRNWRERIKNLQCFSFFPLACAVRSFHCFLKPRSGYLRGSCRRGAGPVRPPHQLGGAHKRGALYSSRRAPSYPARCRDHAASGRAPTSTPPASVPAPPARSPMVGKRVQSQATTPTACRAMAPPILLGHGAPSLVRAPWPVRLTDR